jgi:dTDP-glucose 4,6-dehydratase
MPKLLITGGAGAIGVHLVAHIMHNTDWNVIAMDSFDMEHKGYFDRLTTICKEHPDWVSRIKPFPHDLNAPLTKRQISKLEDIDYVINLASRSDVQNSIDDPRPFVINNVNLMLNILEYVKAVKPKVFIHFSTDEVYGASPKNSGGHKEWDTILPSNPYSASKACQEALAIAWWRCYGIPLIITNTMNNFGEMQAPSKFPAMIQRCIENDEVIKVHSSLSGEMGSRYYLHSRNASDALLFILKNIPPVLHKIGEIDKPLRFNIVGDKQIDNLELVQIISKLMGKPAKFEKVYFHFDNPGHDLHYGLNGDLLKSFGWKSPLGFEESMKNTIKWQQKNKEWIN